jgi:RNA recognition motif-containing protein
MEIYIGNIPKSTRASELKKLIKDSVKKIVFKRLYERALHLGRLDEGIEIQILHTGQFKKKRRYGHINVTSKRLGPVVLEALQTSALRGKELQVREFIQRSCTNDPRTSDWLTVPWSKKCRRKAERRKAETKH